MTTTNAPTNGKQKRNKRDGRKKNETKRQDVGEGGLEKRVAASSSANSIIPSSELTMLMPMLLADPRPLDTYHPRPRQMNLAFTKASDVLGRAWNFYEVMDK